MSFNLKGAHLFVFEPGAPPEGRDVDAPTCGHCGAITLQKPRICRTCRRRICCSAECDVCDVIENKIERMEKA